jgi:hypothetical protein
MSLTLHALSATLFYVFGALFFVAHLLLRNTIATVWSTWWLHISDVSFFLIGLLYGGFSLFLSLQNEGEHPSRTLLLSIGIPFLLIFLFFLFLNYWSVVPS